MTRLRRDDSGGSLIVVLIIVTVGSLVGGALLSLAGTGIHNTIALRGHAETRYAADGALQAAVNNIRNSDFNGKPGQCFGTGTLTLNQFYGADSAAVACTADPGGVKIHCPSLTNCNRPGSAILTLGTDPAEDGLNIKQLAAGSTFRVHGGVFSNSNINVTNGTLTTNSWAYARGPCTGNIVSLPAIQCNYTAPNTFGDDPNYPPAATTAPQHRKVVYEELCKTRESVVRFKPGYYDDAATLSKIMSGNPDCKDSTWWFEPGVYYFDFHNSPTSANRNPLLDDKPNVWEISNGYLVAGTPVNASGGAIAQPTVPPTIPGSCDNPINNANAVGVQFIFGGDSQLVIKSGQAEICGTYSASTPPVAVYGLKSGTETTTPLAVQKPTTVEGSKFSNAVPGSLTAKNDGLMASWKRSGNGQANQSATLSVGGFGNAAAIPAGSILKSAKLRITHRHNDPLQQQLEVKVWAAGDPNPSTGVTTEPKRAGSPTFATDELNLAANTKLAKAVYEGTLSTAKLDIIASVSNQMTVDIDAVELELSYVAPALQGARGCVAQTGYTGGSGGSCALIKSENGSGKPLYVQGTTYAPKGVIDVTLNNAAQQVFRFGIVVRSLWAHLTGSLGYQGPVIEVPDDAPGFGFNVYLTAYVCQGSSTCTTSGVAVARARVAFIDPFPVPQQGQRQVVILSWNTS